MQKLFNDTKGKIGPGMIKAAIIGIIFMVVLLQILPDLIVDGATAVHNLSDSLAAESDVLGSDAASLGGDIDDYTGYFWVVGPLVLVISIIVGIFLRRR